MKKKDKMTSVLNNINYADEGRIVEENLWEISHSPMA